MIFGATTGLTATGVHSVAFKGFNAGAQVYHAARPRYPLTAVEHLFSHQPATSATTPQSILELGSGTGIFTAHIQRHFPAGKITCVEPTRNMSNVALETLSPSPPVKIYTSTADIIPLPDGSVDRIFAAQAFHWFADLASLKEMNRVLKPGGVLGLIWNVEDKNRAPWRQIWELCEAEENGTPQYHHGTWRRVFDGKEAKQWFELPLKGSSFQHEQVIPDKETIWNRVLSKSYISALPLPEQMNLREKIMAILDENELQIDRDDNSHLLSPYQTDVYVAFKK
ncbi:S-adenosyl-L-methionine-dependent methyltransferase [Chytriomyces sp. MP71]|nr:S-adenosyl-L-methionine-dependent methyltransferase [Chytriomyces sp. MP71]